MGAIFRPEYTRRVTLTAGTVKAMARALGADGVGIASAAVLDAHPPDPAHPQIPGRIAPGVRSCVAFFKRIPAGAFRARDLACVHHVDQLVLREMDKVGYRLARLLEDHGLMSHVERMARAPREEQLALLKSRESFMAWQSILRGVGVYSGCTRFVDVCPVGRDWETRLKDAQETIPERTPDKEARLAAMARGREAGGRGPHYARSARWIDGPAAR